MHLTKLGIEVQGDGGLPIYSCYCSMDLQCNCFMDEQKNKFQLLVKDLFKALQLSF